MNYRLWIAKLRSGRDRSVDYNRLHGKFRVLYPDGERSQRMCWDVACGYAEIFGGSVVYAGKEVNQ